MAKPKNDSNEIVVVNDASASVGPDIPSGFELIGHAVCWQSCPSFLAVAGLLDPKSEVKPGQILGVWHGRRERPIVTVIQVGNSFEVNPNEVPDLAAAREALGLGRGYGAEGVSTRIFRLAECATLEEFDIDETAGKWAVSGDGRAPADPWFDLATPLSASHRKSSYRHSD